MKTRRLRTQLTLGMLIFFVGAFGFIYGGTRTLDEWLMSQYQHSLPPAAQRAGRDLEALRLPDPADLQVLNGGFGTRWCTGCSCTATWAWAC
ncbi:MAG: hypothetical protein HEQ37_14810 [Acidovorax sp.]|nr:hypothetical protein [Acidovorax sp.]